MTQRKIDWTDAGQNCTVSLEYGMDYVSGSNPDSEYLAPSLREIFLVEYSDGRKRETAQEIDEFLAQHEGAIDRYLEELYYDGIL